MASALAQTAGSAACCKIGTPVPKDAASSPQVLPIKALFGRHLLSSSAIIRGKDFSTPRRRCRSSKSTSITAQAKDERNLPTEIVVPQLESTEVVSTTGRGEGSFLPAYAAGIIIAAACSLALPKAALAKDGVTAPPPTKSAPKAASKIEIPKKRPGVQRHNIDPDAVKPVPLPNKDGSLPDVDERSARIEARKQQVADFKRRVLREEHAIKKKLEEDPKDEKVLQRLVDVQLMKSDYDGVKGTLRKMIDFFPEDYRYRLMLTEVASGTKDLDEALEVSKEASEKFPRVPEMVQTYAMMLLATDQPDKALSFAKEKVAEAKKTESDDEAGKEFSVGMKLLLGQILSAVGDFEAAHEHFAAMIAGDPSDFRPRVSKGLLYQLKGNKEQAEEQFAKVMELLPADFPEREAVITMIETARRQKSFPDGEEEEEEPAETPADVKAKQAEERDRIQRQEGTKQDSKDQSKGKKKGWKLW